MYHKTKYSVRLVDFAAEPSDFSVVAFLHTHITQPNKRSCKIGIERRPRGGQFSGSSSSDSVCGQRLIQLQNAPLGVDLVEENLVDNAGSSLVQVHRISKAGARLRARLLQLPHQVLVHGWVGSASSLEVPEPVVEEGAVSDAHSMCTYKKTQHICVSVEILLFGA